MTRRDLRLLGLLQVINDDGDVPRFRSQRTMALLGYLVAEQRAISRGALAALFWPDESQSKGRSNLRRELHNLNQILPDCWEMDRQSIRFIPADQITVDAFDFLELEQTEQWVEAAELVRGDFLEGVDLADNLEFETWLSGERERWRQRLERVLTRVIELHIRQADYPAALDSARKLLQLTPWNEAIHRQVMLLLAQTGQREAALKQYALCQMTLEAELSVAVSAETTALYERIKRNTPFTRHNLPAPPTPFIGREEELSQLAMWLDDPQIRLITITGLGGMGKTRLALALAHRLLDPASPELGHPARFPDGLFFVSLVALQSSSQIVSAIAQALAFRFEAQGDPTRQLRDYLSDKRLLLILDNFEHLLDGASTVAALLGAASQLFIIVTSRERLNLHQANVFSIQGLPYPEPGQPNPQSYPAGQLFLQTAQRNQHDFALAETDSDDLTRVCHLMEGMPLGIELAAIWSHTLSLTEIVAEIEQSLDLLQTEAVDLPERHRSMRAAFEITWRYLSQAERDLFANLSVFRGGFTPDAATRIAQATLSALTALVGKSLLRYSQAQQRYDMHELLRQFGAEKCSQNATIEAKVRAAHSRFYCELLRRQKEALLGPEVAKAINVIEPDLDNARLAWHEAVMQGDFENLEKGLIAFMGFYSESGRASEGYEVANFAVQQLKARLTKSPLTRRKDYQIWADILLWCGNKSKAVSKYEEASECYQACLDILRDPALDKLDTREQEAYALGGLGQIATNTDNDQATTLYQRSIALFREIGDQRMVVDYSAMLADTLRNLGDVQGSQHLFQEALAAAQAMDNQLSQAAILESLGILQAQIGHLAEAEESHRQCLALSREMNLEGMINGSLSSLGWTLIWNGKFAEGGSYLMEKLNKGFDKGPLHLAYTHDGLSLAYLHQGQYDQAKYHNERSLSFAHNSGVPRQTAASLWTKGRIALSQDDPVTTEQIWQQSVTILEATDLVGYQGVPLVGLANNAFRRGDLRAMADYLGPSLQIAIDSNNSLSLLDVFPAVALYLLGQRETSLALELYSLASRYAYVNNSRWLADVTGSHIEAAKVRLTTSEVTKAERQGKARDMWATASELLTVLEAK